MDEPIHVLVLLELALTIIIAFTLLVAASVTATTGVTPWAFVRSARMLGLVLFALTAVGAVVHRTLTPDWVHFSWSLTNPLLGLFFGSGAFLCSLWQSERSEEATRARRPVDRSRNGLWFVAAMLLVAFLSVALQWLVPDPAPPERADGRPLAGLLDIATYGLGLRDVPALLVPNTPQGEARGLGFLTRELTIPLGVVSIAAAASIAYAVLGLALRFVQTGPLRQALLLVAPMFVTALAWSTLREFDARHWESDPAVIRSFGPIVAAALAAVAVLGAALVADRRLSTRPSVTPMSRPG